jgi:hypothetical protein
MELKGRGEKEVVIFCTDNLSGIKEAIQGAFRGSGHQKCSASSEELRGASIKQRIEGSMRRFKKNIHIA